MCDVEGRQTLTQQMVDSIFSFGELGFQEVETSRYLVALLKREGFTVEEGVAGIPTAWVATWGSGKPVIALGSDIDGIPQRRRSPARSEEHTSELQSRLHLVCRLLLEKKKHLGRDRSMTILTRNRQSDHYGTVRVLDPSGQVTAG